MLNDMFFFEVPSKVSLKSISLRYQRNYQSKNYLCVGDIFGSERGSELSFRLAEMHLTSSDPAVCVMNMRLTSLSLNSNLAVLRSSRKTNSGLYRLS